MSCFFLWPVLAAFFRNVKNQCFIWSSKRAFWIFSWNFLFEWKKFVIQIRLRSRKFSIESLKYLSIGGLETWEDPRWRKILEKRSLRECHRVHGPCRYKACRLNIFCLKPSAVHWMICLLYWDSRYTNRGHHARCITQKWPKKDHNIRAKYLLTKVNVCLMKILFLHNKMS